MIRLDPVETLKIDGKLVEVDKEAVPHTLAFNELGHKMFRWNRKGNNLK